MNHGIILFAVMLNISAILFFLDRTPIFLAAMSGHTELVDLLADKFKVSVFERAKDGSTLMHIASLHGHPETAIALFRKGVPLQMPNKGGARSLHIAGMYFNIFSYPLHL